MANSWPNGNELYEHIKSEGIIVNKDIWDSIYRHVNNSVTAIILICQHCLTGREAMSAQDAKKILTYAKEIKYAINPITKTSKESLNFTHSKDSIPLNLIIQQLIKHQFGHDVYAIELMLRNAIDPAFSLPIPLEIIQKIIAHAQTIKESIEKFKEAIQQKEEKIYHNLYDSFKDGLVLIDMKGSILDVNQAYLDMFGYSGKEIKKLNSSRLTTEKWHKKEEEIIENLIIKKDYSGEYEKECIKKDGMVFPVSMKVWLIKNKQGEPLGIWAIVRDITERKNTEKEIIEGLLDSHMVIDMISDGITVSDTQGYFEVFNLRMQEITGYTIDEANQAEDFNFLIYPAIEDRQEALKELSKIVTEKEYHEIERAIQAKDGSKKILLVSTSLIRYKKRDMFLSVWRDVTEQRFLQDALRDSEIRFRRLFETAQEGVLILDAYTGQIREVNKFLIDMLGYSRKEFLGKKLWEVGAFIDTDKCKTAFQELQTKEYIRYEHLPLQTKDGRLIEVEFISNVYKIDRDRIIQCSIRDITSRKQTERIKEELSKELEQLTLKDSHTGLFNHRYLKEALENAFAEATRQSSHLSVIMMDIDYFKSINDVYGHMFGDLVLKQFAMQLKKIVRPYDIIVRYGGEEFIIISSDTNKENALILARRILDKINLFNFGDRKHRVKIKISLAIASYPQDNALTGMDLVELADQLLSKAKESGGNRVDISKSNGIITESSDVQSLKDKIAKLTKRASQSLIESTFAFAKTIELKDHYTRKRVDSSVRYTVEIARQLNLPKEKIELIRQATMLHDLGKIGISEEILYKKSGLTKKEFIEIKKHPQIAADIIRPIQALRPIISSLLCHHERWDGKGYPKGLRKDSIPLGARIIAVIDVYQALVSNRPYRKAYSKKKAAAIIQKGSGTQFDPAIVKIFLKILKRKN